MSRGAYLENTSEDKDIISKLLAQIQNGGNQPDCQDYDSTLTEERLTSLWGGLSFGHSVTNTEVNGTVLWMAWQKV